MFIKQILNFFSIFFQYKLSLIQESILNVVELVSVVLAHV